MRHNSFWVLRALVRAGLPLLDSACKTGPDNRAQSQAEPIGIAPSYSGPILLIQENKAPIAPSVTWPSKSLRRKLDSIPESCALRGIRSCAARCALEPHLQSFQKLTRFGVLRARLGGPQAITGGVKNCYSARPQNTKDGREKTNVSMDKMFGRSARRCLQHLPQE